MSVQTEVSLQKLPPQNIEAEQMVLGAILIENDSINKVIEMLSAEDFYKDIHRRIYSVMLDMFESGEAIDLVTLTDALRGKVGLDAAGGSSYLAQLVSLVPTAANIKNHARIVREKSVLRQLIHSSTDIITQSYEDTRSVNSIDELLDRAEESIFKISQQKMRDSFVALKDIVKSSFETIERLYERKEMITGLATGFLDLDKMTSGLQPSDLIIIAGRPSMGKTAFALNIAAHAAMEHHKAVAVFSLEMSKEQLVLRMLCSEARVDAHKLRSGFLSESDWPKLTMAAGRLSEAPIYIDDTAAISVLEMRAKARRLQVDHGLDLIIVDYLQLMRGRSDSDNREQEISNISRSLKALAKELKVPVIALSQLNRAVETRGKDKRPMLADLRECVTGETLVVLADGRRVPIRELVGQAPSVVSISEDGRLLVSQAEKVWHVGQRPIVKIQLASGRIIRTTANHRLMGAHGWCKVGDMNIGDRLAIARELPQPKEIENWPEARLILLGHLIGDGSYLSGQPMRYTTGSDENSHIVADSAQKEFGAIVNRHAGTGNWHRLVISGNGNRWHPSGINKWLRELGIFGQRSFEKRIPRDIFRLGNKCIAILLKHLWATDGTISVRKAGQKGSHGVHFSTNSRGLAEDVSALLLRLGIVARIQTVQVKEYRPTYMVWVYGVEAQRRFLTMVGAFGPRRHQAARLTVAIADVVANTNVDTLPNECFERVRFLMTESGISQRQMATMRGTSYGGSSHFRFSPSRQVLKTYADVLDDDMLRKQSESDIYWDRVAGIALEGEEDVFDLTVPGPASWLADGIVSHNSGAIEQDADVIMFIYRDEVYNKCECPQDGDCLCGRRGVAEAIIGKQRNGPVGIVNMTFMHKYTRFENSEKRGY
jgi:replicative DNA helicase